jgi:Cysteine-rich secretory protein family
VIHYAHFAAQRASRMPLLGAIASLAAIGVCLGDPQAGAGTATAAGLAIANQPVISAPFVPNDERLPRVRTTSDPAIADLPHGPAGMHHVGLALFNRDRAAAGLPPISESQALDAIASTRAQQMVTDGLTHVRPGSTVMAATELLQQNRVPYTLDGENIYWMGGPPFDDAVSSAEAWWRTSPVHRDNILNAHFRQVGVGTATDDGKIYVAAVFTD